MADVTGDTIQVYQDVSTQWEGIYKVKNVSGAGISSKGRKEEITMSTGSSCSICYGTHCYGSGTYVSPCCTHKPDSLLSFACTFNYGTTYTTSIVRFTAYDCGNPNDSVSLYVVFNASPAGIQGHAFNYKIGDAFPNPAANTLRINYQMGQLIGDEMLRIHDLSGKLIKSLRITEINGAVQLDAAELENGLYFCSFEVGERVMAVRKFVICH
ncbi:MAG: T9SS type A sorting domain-containing protein [Bacteroidia bacterium]